MMKRSVSMPVKAPYDFEEDTSNLERCKEQSQLYNENQDDYESSSDNFSFLADFQKRRLSRIVSQSDDDLDEYDEVDKQHSDDSCGKTSVKTQKSLNLNLSTFATEQDLVVPIEIDLRADQQESVDGGKRRTGGTSVRRNRRNSYYQGIPPRTTPTSERLIEKSGKKNINFLNIPERSWRYVQDLTTTLIEQKWRYTFTMFVCSFFINWFLFAILWYLIGYAHGDLIFDPKTGERMGEGQDACVIGAKDFTGFFTYTVETTVSIGYGEKYPSEECPEGVFIFVAQIIIGIAIEGAMVGIVYAKMSRPPKRISKLRFSKKAVISQRDGQLCLMFRVCDPREKQTIGTKVRLFLSEERKSQEGEILGRCHSELKLQENGNIMIMWPAIVCHVIDDTSPLYDCSFKDLGQKEWELIVTLVGSSPSTGQLTESITSYLSKEIFWGQRFVNIVHYDWNNDQYAVNYDNFHSTVLVPDPLCSAKRLAELEKLNNGKPEIFPKIYTTAE